MSRLILTRLAWVAVGLVAIVTAAFAIQPIMSGPEDLDLGPVVHNTHEPVPSPTQTQPEASDEPTEGETSAPESQPVQPAPPVVVEDDDDDDDDWDDDDWDDDDDDWDDDWDDDDD